MQLEFVSGPFWQRTHPGGNYTANKGYETRVPQVLPPLLSTNTQGNQAAGDGVIEVGQGGSMSETSIKLIPYGTAASGVVGIQIVGWRPTNLQIGPALWVPVLLATYSVTLAASGCIGVAGSDLGTSNFFGVTYTMTGGPLFTSTASSGTLNPAVAVTPDWYHVSPGGTAQAGMIHQRTFGFRFIEVMLNTTGSNTPAANCLYCKGGAI